VINSTDSYQGLNPNLKIQQMVASTLKTKKPSFFELGFFETLVLMRRIERPTY